MSALSFLFFSNMLFVILDLCCDIPHYDYISFIPMKSVSPIDY